MSSKFRFALCAMVVLSIVLSPTEAGARLKKPNRGLSGRCPLATPRTAAG